MRFRVLAVAVVLGACAAAPPPPSPPPPPAEQKKAGKPPEAESEIGGMNPEAVGKAFDALGEPIGGCIEKGAKRVRELGGRFLISLRVDREGRATWAYLSESTLGDRETERCIVDLVRAAEWPRPKGGEGLATRSLEIDPGAAPVIWEERLIQSAVRRNALAFAKCRKGRRGAFVATAYVRPNGRVLSAGIQQPDPESEEVADCLAGAVRKMGFGSPGRRAAKVTFEVP